MPYDDELDEEWTADDDDSADDLLECPACRHPVHEDTQQCPHCGDWITPAYPQRLWRKTIWLIAVCLVIFSLLMVAVF